MLNRLEAAANPPPSATATNARSCDSVMHYMHDQHFWNSPVIAYCHSMESRSFLILHGIANDRPPGHWQFLLAAHLTTRGHQVLYPALPSPNNPMYVTWKAELHDQLAQMRGGERVVVCHSLACLLWLRAAPALGDHERVDRLLLVSPPTSARVPEAGSSFRLEQGP